MFTRHMKWMVLCLIVLAIGCQRQVEIDISASASGSNDTNKTDAGSDDDVEIGGGDVTSSDKVIGYSAMDLSNPFFQLIGEVMAADAKEQGFEIVVEDAGSAAIGLTGLGDQAEDGAQPLHGGADWRAHGAVRQARPRARRCGRGVLQNSV